jgi:hypothetical protein
MIGYGTSLHSFEMRGNARNGTFDGSRGFRRFVMFYRRFGPHSENAVYQDVATPSSVRYGCSDIQDLALE